jgi:hypothetical protein
MAETFCDRWFVLATQAKFMALYSPKTYHFPSLGTVAMVSKSLENGHRYREAIVDKWMNAEDPTLPQNAANITGAEFVEDLAAALLVRNQQLRLRLRLPTERLELELRARAQFGDPPAYRL